MYQTLKMMKSILNGKECKVDEKELIMEYQEKLSPNILAYFYCNNFGLILQISKSYSLLSGEDIASFCLQELDLSIINKTNSKNIKIGELNIKVIKILGLDLKPQNINIWSTRIQEHCEKHKSEYSSPTSYNQAIRLIPEIIKNPDYVGLHKNGNIQYVKKLDEISLIGIQILKGSGHLLFRTIFPISETKLKNSIKSGKLIPYNK